MPPKIIIPLIFILGLALGWLGFDYFILDNSPTKEVRVDYVIDGDTFKLADGTRVRIIGIDSPEKGACYYEEARQALKDLIEGQTVRLDKDVSEKDRYDRLLRHVFLAQAGEDNIMVGDYLVRQGFAFDISSPPDNRYRQLLSSAAEEAKRENRGLWPACDYEADSDLGEHDSGPTNPDCIVKGNIFEKSYGKTYLIPGCDNYERVKIDTRKGEQYFCSEAEAQSAGFRKATNCP